MHTWSPSTWVVETGGSWVQVQVQSGLYEALIQTNKQVILHCTRTRGKTPQEQYPTHQASNIRNYKAFEKRKPDMRVHWRGSLLKNTKPKCLGKYFLRLPHRRIENHRSRGSEASHRSPSWQQDLATISMRCGEGMWTAKGHKVRRLTPSFQSWEQQGERSVRHKFPSLRGSGVLWDPCALAPVVLLAHWISPVSCSPAR